MKLLVISSNTPATGNEVTMQRICSFFTSPSSTSISRSSSASNNSILNRDIQHPDNISDTISSSLVPSQFIGTTLPWTVERLNCNTVSHLVFVNSHQKFCTHVLRSHYLVILSKYSWYYYYYISFIFIYRLIVQKYKLY